MQGSCALVRGADRGRAANVERAVQCKRRLPSAHMPGFLHRREIGYTGTRTSISG